jgi:trans-aconitate methyltransferase
MEHIKQLYKDAFKQHGDSPSSVLWPKGRQDERFYALTRHIKADGGFSVADYGCGLAHFKEYLDQHYSNVIYTGVDIVEDFLNHNKTKYPDSHFVQPEELFNGDKTYDYILASGTFNILYVNDEASHKKIVFDVLEKLFSKTNRYLSVNFMTDQVDFKQDTAFHMNVTELYEFCSRSLSKRMSIDQSYMPYEYTITLWKDTTVLRPENIYSPL